MAPQKSSAKAKKGSKLASIKKAIFGAPKGKPAKAAAPKKAAPAPKAAAKPTKPVKAAAPAKVVAAKPAPKVATPAPAPAPAKVAKAPKGKAGQNVNKAGHAASQALNALKRGSSPIPSYQSRSGDSDSVCREVACEGLNTTGGYCRLHYIKNWKKIKRKELILKEKKLNSYIEELVVKYPDKYIEAIRQDLASDKDFAKVIYDLDLDESVDDFEGDGESAEGIIDNIKRDFEDGDDGF